MAASPEEPDDTAPDSEALAVVRKVVGDAVVVTVAGEIDLATHGILKAELETVLQFPLRQTVLLDLADVSFLSSSGINVLVQAHKQARLTSTRLRIIATSRGVRRPLELMNLIDQLKVFPDRATAMSDLADS